MQTPRLPNAVFKIARNRRLIRVISVCLIVSSLCLFSVWIASNTSFGHLSVAQRSFVVDSDPTTTATPYLGGVSKPAAIRTRTLEELVSTPASASSITTEDPKAPTATAASSKNPQEIPTHISELFAVKELKLVALDPIILKCVTTGKCMHLTASASVQVGTWLNDTTEVESVFHKHFKGKAWKIKVLCSHAAVITKHYWRGFDKTIALSVIQQHPDKDYLKIEMEKDAEIVERAFDRFNTTIVQGITVPADIPLFELWWNNGQFIHCNSTLAEKFVSNTTIITAEHISNLKTFTNLLISTGQIPCLAFGTLLGWYRNCGVIPYTTDIDVGVQVAEYQEDFMEELKQRKDFRLLRYIGSKEYGLEITVRIPGTVKDAYADVFYLFPHNATYDWAPTTYGKSSGWLRLKTLIPKSTQTCTGDVHGFLFFVPCNFIDVIVTSYGKTDWLQPVENYSYSGKDRLTFVDGHWNETLDDVIQSF